MGRKPIGAKPMTSADRQARKRWLDDAEREVLRHALRQIVEAKTLRKARELAVDALRTADYRDDRSLINVDGTW
jgi:hypothetical protein